MKIVFSGGGTAGHVFPSIVLYEKLSNLFRDLEIHYFVNPRGMEMKILKDHFKSRKITLHILKMRGLKRPFLRRKNLVLNTYSLILFFLSLVKVFFLLKRIKPDIIFLTGGYMSAPVGLAAHILKIPFFIHEGNVKMGITNIFLSKYASKIFLSFEETMKQLNSKLRKKAYITGMPVRKIGMNKEKILKIMNLDPNKPIISVLGGSKGSDMINTTMIKIYENLKDEKRYQFIHATGDEKVSKFLMENYDFVRSFSFSESMLDFMANSDLIISRAGAVTIGEIIHYKIPAILIPWEGATENHQLLNAKILAKENAVMMIREKNLTPKILLEYVEKVLSMKKEMLRNLSKFYVENSSEKMVKVMLKLLGKIDGTGGRERVM